MNFQELEQLGPADLTICGLQLWVHGREFPAATDFWDGNWLRVTAYCNYPHSAVRIQNQPCVRLDELAGLLMGCERMHATLHGKAELQCLEPYLAVELLALSRGSIGVTLSLTPDHWSERHEFKDGIDQSYLPEIIRGCKAILERFPVREAE